MTVQDIKFDIGADVYYIINSDIHKGYIIEIKITDKEILYFIESEKKREKISFLNLYSVFTNSAINVTYFQTRKEAEEELIIRYKAIHGLTIAGVDREEGNLSL